MTINRRYVPAFNIETVMLDKDTGEPLSNGVVTFYRDVQRGDMKNVWQISGTAPNYIFTQLPNPMTLSSIGTFVDNSGNPVVPYFLPYDSDGDLDYYYVTVESAGGVEQFDRQSVPHVGDIPDSPDDATSFENMLSNPQFVEVNFDTSSSTYTYNVTTSGEFDLAPDWVLVVTGTGTVVVERKTPAGSTDRPTNAPYFLNFTTTGSISALALRQRLNQNPSIWAGKRVSTQMTGKSAVDGSLYSIEYQPSSGTTQALLNNSFPDGGVFGTITDNTLLPDSDSGDEAPAGYVDIVINLLPSVETEISSLQVSFTDEAIIDVPYIQTPRNRQVDQLYHDAYPIVPVGSIIDYGGFGTPDHYLLCDGSTINRVEYQQLYRALTTKETVNLTSASPTFTVADGTLYHIGMAIEGSDIPASTTINNIVGNTITMSANATATTSSEVTFYAWGNGNGTTTFTLPDLREYVTAGAGGSLFSAGRNGVGYQGGASTHQIQANELPPHAHPVALTVWDTGASGTVAKGNDSSGANTANFNTSNNVTANTAMTIVQKTALVNKFIRYE